MLKFSDNPSVVRSGWWDWSGGFEQLEERRDGKKGYLEESEKQPFATILELFEYPATGMTEPSTHPPWTTAVKVTACRADKANKQHPLQHGAPAWAQQINSKIFTINTYIVNMLVLLGCCGEKNKEKNILVNHRIGTCASIFSPKVDDT